jgi:hypothetical protein
MCTRPDHEALKANQDQLAALTIAVGTQHDADGIALYELRNCLRCGSSLAIEPTPGTGSQPAGS